MATVPGLRRSLLAWYDRHRRDLPWRRTRDPYRIWLSEILLQQTRVETVIPYYLRLLRSFPDVTRLAAAKLDPVLRLWEGLGYYGRARRLHQAARLLARGGFPRTVEAWRRIPGVGPYTAGAIASIAFGERAPVLDGNVKRVLARLFRLRQDISRPATVRSLWSLARRLVPRDRPGDFNQALMELGALLCVPRSPRCADCPLARSCAGRAAGHPERLPVRKARRPTPHFQVVAAALLQRGRYLLCRRSQDKMLGGLWEFPGGKMERGETGPQALRREMREELGVTVRVDRLLASVDHAFSHFSITLHLYACSLLRGRPQPGAHSAVRWVPPSRFDGYAMPAADRRLTRTALSPPGRMRRLSGKAPDL